MLVRQRPNTAQPARPAGERPRLLIVDDDPTNCMLLQATFERDYLVTTAANGRQALDRIAAQPYDLVLLDIMMPVLNGMDTLRALRLEETTADLPVILLSARTEQQDVIAGLKAGANDYITKPLSIDIVRARVQTQLKLKRLTDEHKQTIHDLEISQQMQEHFFRIVSHDLKGPLTNLRMAHYLLRELTGNNPVTADVLENIDLSLNEMQELIRTFLDVAALHPGRLDMKLECLSINDALKKVVEQYTLMATNKGVHVRLESRDVPVYADPRLYSQILSNLVSNAIKYTQPGTTVTIWAETDGRWTRVCVADQGAGIPDGERPRLFQMFSKLSTRPTAGENSSGLGLWIVKMLVESMNGMVDVECPAEGGSIFFVDLPACKPE